MKYELSSKKKLQIILILNSIPGAPCIINKLLYLMKRKIIITVLKCEVEGLTKKLMKILYKIRI